MQLPTCDYEPRDNGITDASNLELLKPQSLSIIPMLKTILPHGCTLNSTTQRYMNRFLVE